jgi:hypothetical protein
MLEYLRGESDKAEVFNDKMRLLLIAMMCGNDVAEVRPMIEVMKELHKDKFDNEFVETVMKRRVDFEVNNS